MTGLFKKLLRPFRDQQSTEPAIPEEARLEIVRQISHAIQGSLFGVTSVCAALKLAIEEKKETQPLVDHMMQACGSYRYSLMNFAEFFRYEAGLHDVTYEPVSVRRVLRRTLDECMGGEAAEKDLSIEADVDRDTPEQLAGDPLRIGLIIWNLLRHAIETADPGSAIRIRVHKTASDQWSFRIEREQGKPVDTGRFFDLGNGSPTANLDLFITRHLTTDLLKGAIEVSATGSTCVYLVSLPWL